MQEKTSHIDCIVLCESAGDLPAALRASLAQQKYRIELLRDPHRAFGRLCLLDRLESVRSGWGLERSGTLTLVIAGESNRQAMQQMLNARDHYLPTVGILEWRDDALVELRPATIPPTPAPSAFSKRDPDSVPPAPSAPSARARNEHSSGPNLHLVEPPDDQPRIRHQSVQTNRSGSDNGEENPTGAAAPLSPDEVRMLLGSSEQNGPNS